MAAADDHCPIALFDRGLINFDTHIRLITFRRLKQTADAAELWCSFGKFKGSCLAQAPALPTTARYN